MEKWKAGKEESDRKQEAWRSEKLEEEGSEGKQEAWRSRKYEEDRKLRELSCL